MGRLGALALVLRIPVTRPVSISIVPGMGVARGFRFLVVPCVGAMLFAAPASAEPVITGSLKQWTDSICVMASMDVSKLRYWLPRAFDGGNCSTRPEYAGSYQTVAFGIYRSKRDAQMDAEIGSSRGACCGTGPYAVGYTIDLDENFVVMFATNRGTPEAALLPLEKFGFVVVGR